MHAIGNLPQPERSALSQVGLFGKVQQGQALPEPPFVRDRSHHTAHEHPLVLPTGIPAPVEPREPLVDGTHIFSPSDKALIVQVRFSSVVYRKDFFPSYFSGSGKSFSMKLSE